MATLHLPISQHPQQPAPQPTQYSVKAVKSWLVPSYWEFVSHYIGEALEHANGELEADDIYQYLLTERMYLFVVGTPICGAATCEVVQYVRKKAIRVVTLGGENFGAWKSSLQDAFVKWADGINADSIEAYVRKGLAQHLEGLGYKQIYLGMTWERNQDNRR